MRHTGFPGLYTLRSENCCWLVQNIIRTQFLILPEQTVENYLGVNLQVSQRHTYSAESIDSIVVIIRNSISTLSVTLQKNTEKNYCEKSDYITCSYFGLFRCSRPELSIFENFIRKYQCRFLLLVKLQTDCSE